MTIWEALARGYRVTATEVDENGRVTRSIVIEHPHLGQPPRSGLAEVWYEKADWFILSGLFAFASALAVVLLWL